MKIALPVLKANSFTQSRIKRIRKLVRDCEEDAGKLIVRLLHQGNEKLGAGIWHFSMPPVVTCPTMTPSCAESCYAVRYSLRFPSVTKAYTAAYAASRRSDFVERILSEIREESISIVRLHASGEFYNASYAKKWLQIFRSARSTKFFFYTRSWRNRAMRRVLLEMSRLSNVYVWFSCDRDTGIPKRLKSIRLAYMAIDNTDVPEVPVDLVFRVRNRGIKTIRLGGSLVCPVENGTEGGKHLDCTDCRLCFKTAWIRDFRQFT